MRLYLDSSVLVKLYKQEKDSDLMDKMIQRVDKGEWHAFSSKWAFLEITRALKKDKKPKEIITLDIEDLKLHRINFISLRDELIPIAERLVKETNLYAADAFHLATFEWINKDEKIDAFLCDDRHFERLKAFVPVKKPFDLFL